MDRLCLQYVATTRPVEQLFFYLQKEKSKNNIEILDFIQSKNIQNLDEFDLYETHPEMLKKQIIHKKSEFKTENIQNLRNEHENKSSIKIATPSKNYQVRNEKVRIGLFVHELLSKINTEKDIDKVFGDLCFGGANHP
ncbi:hypothetical protein [Chryseobacterium indoltheticum]|uniref:hypothetical protein n=1 Tax=Chryseobacterium indoltheticum TaxID=254 RepID=UPI003F493635